MSLPRLIVSDYLGTMSISMEMMDLFIDSLKEYLAKMFYHYPAMVSSWSTMDSQEQTMLAHQKVEEVLTANGLLYPSMNDWSNTQFHPAYGLLPVMEDPKMS